MRADLRAFRRNFGIDARSFSTGFAFQYHEWYADKENADEFEKGQESYNKHDFGGHSLSALFVRAHFESLKAETLSSGFVSAAVFEESVVEKAKRYIASADGKAMKCKEDRDPLHFGINGRTWNKKMRKYNDGADPLRVAHLHALFLYTISLN